MAMKKGGRKPKRARRHRLLRMAHDLKTPLATVRDSAELLADGTLGPLSEVQKEVAEILRRNSRKLQRLIDHLLSSRDWRRRERT